MADALAALEGLLLDSLLPARCLHCGARAGGPWRPHLCEPCTLQLPWISPTWLRVAPDVPPLFALLTHGGPARGLLHGLKYDGLRRVGRRLGVELARRAPGPPGELPPGSWLQGIPLHPLRRWRRGHDQVSALVAGVRSVYPWLRTGRLLRRVRPTRSQVGLTVSRRRANVARAFESRAAASSAAPPVVLVDDVVTTGATLAAATTALRAAGWNVTAAIAAALAERALESASPVVTVG